MTSLHLYKSFLIRPCTEARICRNTVVTSGILTKHYDVLRIKAQNRLFSHSSKKSTGRTTNNGSRSGMPYYVTIPSVATVGLIGYAYFAFLDEVPLTHRKRWIATNPAWEESLGHQEYKKMLAYFKKEGKVLPPNHRASITVRRVGSNIAKAAQKFAKENKLATISNSPWTYTVVKSDSANAFVLPGNHVFVMTGLFRYIQDEDDLASVLAHETSHNLARHAGEKMSSSLVVNLMARLSLLIDPSGLFLAIFLPGTKLLRELPHSRTQETEADQIGVYLAAEACFDPRAAKRVFAAMKEGMDGSSGKSAPPEFLSTHPSHDKRITNFDKWLPEAMKIYNGDVYGDGDRCRNVRQQMKEARKDAAYRAMLIEHGKSS